MLRKTLLVVTLISMFFLLLGCQTVQGIGRDMTWVGQKLSGDTAE